MSMDLNNSLYGTTGDAHDRDWSIERLIEAMETMLLYDATCRQREDYQLSKLKPCPVCWQTPRLNEKRTGLEMCYRYYHALLKDSRVKRADATMRPMTSIDTLAGYRLLPYLCFPMHKKFDIAIGQ